MRLLLFAILFSCSPVQPLNGNFNKEEPMSAFPPDNWEVESGEWGTDIDLSASVVGTGAHSLHFLGTTPASDPALLSGYQPTFHEMGMSSSDHRLYVIGAVVQADSITAGNTLLLEVDLYTEAKVYDSTISIHNAILASTGAWQGIGGTVKIDQPYYKIRIGKNNTAFNAYFDRVIVHGAPMFTRVYRSSTRSISDNTWTTLLFNTKVERGVDYNTSTGVFTVYKPGIYQISSTVHFDSLADGQKISIRVKYAATSQFFRGGTQFVGGSGQAGCHVTHTAALGAGDTIEIQVYQTGASASKNASAGEAVSWARVVELVGRE